LPRERAPLSEWDAIYVYAHAHQSDAVGWAAKSLQFRRPKAAHPEEPIATRKQPRVHARTEFLGVQG
jgi:hypothetical protein